jgi:succinoglycan biosynthesis protein ExoL
VIAPTMSQPRYHRRVRALLDAGFQVTVYAFARGYYRENAFPAGTELVNIGSVEDGAYFRRIPGLIQAARRIRREELRTSRKPDVTYAFGLENALIALRTGLGQSLVYEVGDLRNPEPDRALVPRFLWRVERHIIRKAALLVVTSPAFISDYYARLLEEFGVPSLVIENRIPEHVVTGTPRSQFSPIRRPLRLGVIGLLRYEPTLAPLLEWVGARPADYELDVYGDGPLRDLVLRRAEAHSNVRYHGSFRNPEDLSSIFGNVDVCYCVYDSRDRNVRLALPNKLFEAPYFGVPLIVADDTALAQRVRELKVGVAVNPLRPDFLDELPELLTTRRLHEMKVRALALPTDKLMENPTRLVEALAAVMTTRRPEC